MAHVIHSGILADIWCVWAGRVEISPQPHPHLHNSNPEQHHPNESLLAVLVQSAWDNERVGVS